MSLKVACRNMNGDQVAMPYHAALAFLPSPLHHTSVLMCRDAWRPGRGARGGRVAEWTGPTLRARLMRMYDRVADYLVACTLVRLQPNRLAA